MANLCFNANMTPKSLKIDRSL
jgi:hypothetical protein